MGSAVGCRNRKSHGYCRRGRLGLRALHRSPSGRYRTVAIPRGLARVLILPSIVFGLILASRSPAQETPAFAFSEPGTGVTAAGTDGFRFTPVVDLVVTSLGYYDRGQDGLADVHPVALFSAPDGRLLAAVQVANRSARQGNFRFEPIQPIVLRAGQSYIVAGFTPGNGDPPADTPEDLRIAPQIGYDGYLFEFADRLAPPTNNDLFAERTFFGPNFTFHPARRLLSQPVERRGSHVARHTSKAKW